MMKKVSSLLIIALITVNFVFAQQSSCDSISLNTGHSPSTGYGIPDLNWNVIGGPVGWSVGGPAFTINKFSLWGIIGGTEWISWQPVAIWTVNNASPNPPITFAKRFCILDSITQARPLIISGGTLFDDIICIELYNVSTLASYWIPITFSNVPLGSYPPYDNPITYPDCDNPNPSAVYPSTASGYGAIPPNSFNSTFTSLPSGTYELRVRLRNLGGSVMGFDMKGSIKTINSAYPLSSPLFCCSPCSGNCSGKNCKLDNGIIAVQKRGDNNCNGLLDPLTIDPPLTGWTFTLNPGGITKTTDATGWVYFGGLPTGTYTITEILQPGWTAIGAISKTVSITCPDSLLKQIVFLNSQCYPPKPCYTCKTVIKSESVTQGSLTTGTAYDLQALTLNFTSLTALQEVNISIANLSYTWDKDGCKNCKTDAIGRGCLYPQSAAQTIGTLVWDNVHGGGVPPAANPSECPGELIWDLGSPLPPNSYSVPLNITLPIPTVPGCCNLHLNSLCLKVTYKDINCNTCDTIICMDTSNCCKGGYWKSEQYSWPPPNQNPNKVGKQVGTGVGTPIGNVVNIKCNNQQTPYVLTCNALYNLQAVYVCADKSCPAKTTYHVFGLTSSSGTLPASYTPTASGTYPITYYAWCGNKICDSCRFWITVSCASTSSCTCSFNPALSGEGHPNTSVKCGGSVTWFASNIPVNLNPGFSCVDTNGLLCKTPGTFTATLTNIATAAVTTLTGPNYSYTFIASGTYTYSLTGSCGGHTCSCSFNLIIP